MTSVQRLLDAGYYNQAVRLGASLEEGLRSRAAKPSLHVLLRGGSLPLPRPLRYDEFSVQNPSLATRLDQTFPFVFADALQARTTRPVRLTNTAYRGMTWEEFERGVGQGILDMLLTMEPDIFITSYGYSSVWKAEDRDDLFAASEAMASQYADHLATWSAELPLLTTLVVGLPRPGPLLGARYPRVSDAIRIFNEVLSAELAGRTLYVPPPDEGHWLHTDEQHFSTEGHRVLGERLLELVSSFDINLFVGGFRRSEDDLGAHEQ